jgi:hypothetical protein
MVHGEMCLSGFQTQINAACDIGSVVIVVILSLVSMIMA